MDLFYHTIIVYEIQYAVILQKKLPSRKIGLNFIKGMDERRFFYYNKIIKKGEGMSKKWPKIKSSIFY